jgi:cell wall-associated NlpC family hydrolase
VRSAAWLPAVLVAGAALAQEGGAPPAAPPAPEPGTRAHLRARVDAHLGKPYVWGATGLKSFDCSGFVWRAMLENGIFVKRTTARKFFMCLKKVDESRKWEFPTLVFFDDLQHIGIVNDSTSFYHAQCSRGTNLSELTPFWKAKICGFRAMPVSGLQGPPLPPPGPAATPEPAAPGEPEATPPAP